jgi:hypothetical protein
MTLVLHKMRYAPILLYIVFVLNASCGSPVQNSSTHNGMAPVTLPQDSNGVRSDSMNANCTTCITMPHDVGTPRVNDQAGEVPPPETVIKNADPNFYKGCWMASETAGFTITDTTIQTERSNKPLRYQDVTDEAARASGMHVLEILDKDESNQLKKFIGLESKPNDEMQGRGYDTLEDVKTRHPNTIYALLGKTDCQMLAPLLKGAGAKKPL